MSKSFPDSVAEVFGSTSINQSKWGEELLKQFLASSGQISDMWKAISADVTNRTIITKVQGNPSVEYKTHIRIDGDIVNEFPSNPPDENDIYWKRHKDNVDEALAIRKEIALKAIDVAGLTVRGIVNPISISPIDLAKLIETAKG